MSKTRSRLREPLRIMTGELEDERALTYPGQAHFAVVGTDKVCRNCLEWDGIGIGMHVCLRTKRYTDAVTVPFPGHATACKHYIERREDKK